MEDAKIVELFFSRSEEAIAATMEKYGAYCQSIAYRILHSREDAEECVNDALVKAWGAIPPKKPTHLGTFIGRITRNKALDRLDYQNAKKRPDEVALILEEIGDTIPANAADNVADRITLRDAINDFLGTLSKKERCVFLRRYWYFSSLGDIARDYGHEESYIRIMLFRTRNKLRLYLEKEGITL